MKIQKLTSVAFIALFALSLFMTGCIRDIETPAEPTQEGVFTIKAANQNGEIENRNCIGCTGLSFILPPDSKCKGFKYDVLMGITKIPGLNNRYNYYLNLHNNISSPLSVSVSSNCGLSGHGVYLPYPNNPPSNTVVNNSVYIGSRPANSLPCAITIYLEDPANGACVRGTILY